MQNTNAVPTACRDRDEVLALRSPGVAYTNWLKYTSEYLLHSLTYNNIQNQLSAAMSCTHGCSNKA